MSLLTFKHYMKQNSWFFLVIMSFRCPSHAHSLSVLNRCRILIRLISYYRWDNSICIWHHCTHVHYRPLLYIGESSLRSHIKPMWMWKTYWWGSTASGFKQEMPLIPEREMAQGPLIKDQFMCYQAPQGSRFIPHRHLRRCAQCEYEDSGS